MATESPKQPSVEKAKKPRLTKTKKLIKKASAKITKNLKSKTVKVATVAKPKVVKVVKAKTANNRKINSKPVLAKTTGINISPAKVKNIVSNYVLNKDAYSALTELKNARRRVITKVVDGKEVSENFDGIPVANLSSETLDYITFAHEQYETSQREDYAKSKISAMPESVRKDYNAAKHIARDEYEKKSTSKYLDNSDSTFNCEQFNLTRYPDFYDTYNTETATAVAADTSDEWKRAIDKVTKLKNRFSTNSRVFLSAFVEYIIKQLAMNGTVCCVADKKKIIQLSHILDTTKEGFEERFPLYPLIVNLDTFKQAHEYLKNPPPAKVTTSDTDDEKSDTHTKSNKVEKDNDVFHIDGVSLETQYQFRYYIAESCRETRMDLASESGDETSVYNYTSVSKIFKNFCSTLICEFLMRIGTMLSKEIETRGIKTVNDTIIGTVISHYHTVCGVDETNTINFIREVTTKYYKYVADRQQRRKDIALVVGAETSTPSVGAETPTTK
jgi:hypothetical protein